MKVGRKSAAMLGVKCNSVSSVQITINRRAQDGQPAPISDSGQPMFQKSSPGVVLDGAQSQAEGQISAGLL